jgi:hypothetical protein
VIAGLLAALAALTRPDGLVYVAALPIAVALYTRRGAVRRSVRAISVSVLAFAIPVVGYLVVRLTTFDDYLPNTARAKKQDLVPSLADLGRVGELASYVGLITVGVGAVVVFAALLRPSTIRTAVLMVLIPLVLAVAGFVTLQPDWMGQLRFATPIWPLAMMVFSLSVVEVAYRANFWGRGLLAALVFIAVVSPVAQMNQSDKVFRGGPTVALCRVALSQGYLFNGFADILGIRAGSLLTPDAGGTALTSRLRFVDLDGLADRRIARLWQDDDMAALRDYVLDEVRPTFVILFAGWYPRTHLGLTDDPRFLRDYALMFTGDRDGGEWVRRDALPRGADLTAAAEWGRLNWDVVAQRYSNHVPQLWTCGDTLRPTPFHEGSPAPSPLTVG